MVVDAEVEPGLEILRLLPILDVLGVLVQMNMGYEVSPGPAVAHKLLCQLPMLLLVLAASVVGWLSLGLRCLYKCAHQIVRLYLLEGLFLHF